MNEPAMANAQVPGESGPAHCENCGAALQGLYCHACGQPMHSPVRSFAHAVEDVFDSFWHLDGRVFRTLRDLVFPGRVARSYLAGQRVRYIAPLRLFVTLSLLTFFIGKLTVHAEGGAIGFDAREGALGRAQTIAQVEQVRDALLKELQVKEDARVKRPGADPALVAARIRIEREAASRIAELKEETRQVTAPQAVTSKHRDPQPDRGTRVITPSPGDVASRRPADAAVVDGEATSATTGWPLSDPANAWDARTDPIEVSWLPDFANRWLTRKMGKAQKNLQSMGGDPDRYLQTFLGTLPTALFLLMPVFALLLKLFYIGTRRLYLEHLVVALYSHVFLLLSLMALFVINAIQSVVVPAAATGLDLAQAAIYVWMPLYLLLTQKRVYDQAWWLTLLKYLVLGSVYFVLVGLAMAYAALSGLMS